MAARELAHWTSADAAARLTGAAVFLPLGSTEPHGPHLPLATDTILAEEACRRAAALLEARGVKACVAPAIPFTVTDFSEGFAGRVSIPREVSTAFIREAALALAAAGCAKVVLTTFHFEPGHLACARDAAAACQAKGAPVVFVDLTKRRFAERIGGEFATGSCHAGSFETSLVLAARQDLVDSKRAAGLPELQVPLPEKMRAGVKTFRECGMADAYCGAPAAATPAEGERLYAILTEILAEAAAP